MKKLFFIFAFLIFVFNFINAEESKTIIDDWNSIKAPAAPELKSIKVDSKTTALLILDIQSSTCNAERRPRCIACLPKISKLLKDARKSKMLVVYSLTSNANPEDILAEVKSKKNDPIVKSSVDKFYNTELEKILKGNKIETVIIIGTAAEGAVLHTATGASIRNFKVIVPVDGMPSSDLYAEQYTAWHLVNAPGTRRNTTLTKIDLITIE